MNKKESSIPKESRDQKYEAKKKKDKDLPWWVELLFVQIGLPDKLLIKILKNKKKAKELIKDEKKTLITFLFLILTLAYFYPVIKHAKNKLRCEAIAKNFITQKKNITPITKGELNMLSTNLCNGGEEFLEIEDFKN